MKYNYTLLFLILIYGSIKGQNIDSKFALSNANKSYDIGDYVSSIEKYNSANKLDTSNNISMFNAGNAAFMKGEFEEANSYYENYINKIKKDTEKAEALYNIGNSYFNDYKKNNNQESLSKSIESYKQSLRLNPKDADTRYNLSKAMKIAMQQQDNQDQENKDQDNQDQQNNDQENKDQQDKDQENKDQENKDQENKDQENKDQKNKGQKDKEQENKDQKDKKQEENQKQNNKPQSEKERQQKPTMGQEQALKNLDAINSDEEKVLLKVNRKKGDEKKASKTKDW